MSLLRIDSSILGPHSSSRALADTVQQHWLAEHPDAEVVTRDLAADPVLATSWSAAVAAGQTPAEEQTEEQKAALALSQELLAELKAAETVIVATGLYNWGVNQLLRSWIDQVFVASGPSARLLEGKDVALVVTRGGYYGDDGPKAGWDHGTPYLQRIFADAWGANVTVIERDFTMVGANPALDEFKEQGAALKEAAEAKAGETGKALAAAYTERISA